jgi:hypothetical protein
VVQRVAKPIQYAVVQVVILFLVQSLLPVVAAVVQVLHQVRITEHLAVLVVAVLF